MNLGTSVRGQAEASGPVTARQVVATYDTYDKAQRGVDHLSDSGFPVEHSSIVGRDLRLVEMVLGRQTTSRAALMGAASGAWFGLFIGTFATLFLTGPEWVVIVLAAVIIGAVAGGVYGFAAHWATHGVRDFASASTVMADRFDVEVTEDYAERATELLFALR